MSKEELAEERGVLVKKLDTRGEYLDLST